MTFFYRCSAFSGDVFMSSFFLFNWRILWTYW